MTVLCYPISDLSANRLKRLSGQIFHGNCRLGNFNFSYNRDLEDIADEVFDTTNLRQL